MSFALFPLHNILMNKQAIQHVGFGDGRGESEVAEIVDVELE